MNHVAIHAAFFYACFFDPLVPRSLAFKVPDDVQNAYISLARTGRDYGVVIDPEALTIEATATEELRNEKKTVSETV